MNKEITVLVTGANGFIGQILCRILLDKGYRVHATVRSKEKVESLSKQFNSPLFTCFVTGELDDKTDWFVALNNVEIVVHLAARVHILEDVSQNVLDKYKTTNVEATQHLANSSFKSGVKRLVFISSIAVHGSQTGILPNQQAQKFNELEKINCKDPYGKSKWEAEQILTKISKTTGLETVILRPPLVYGYGVKANFQKLVRLITSGIPIPLASLKNQRNMIYVGNLVDAIMNCSFHPAAAGQTYVVCDNESISTPDLIREIAKLLNKPALLFPFPIKIMRIAAKVLRKQAIINRLTGSLLIDGSKIKRELNWNPPYTLQQGLQRDFAELTDKVK